MTTARSCSRTKPADTFLEVDSSAQLEKNIAAADVCIANGKRQITEQRKRIQRMREDTANAERVLQYMETVQARYVATKARLQRMLGRLPGRS